MRRRRAPSGRRRRSRRRRARRRASRLPGSRRAPPRRAPGRTRPVAGPEEMRPRAGGTEHRRIGRLLELPVRATVGLGAARSIEDVVGDLEREPEVLAIIRETTEDRGRRARDEATGAGRDAEQRARLARVDGAQRGERRPRPFGGEVERLAAHHAGRAGRARYLGDGLERARRRSLLLVLQWAADEPPGLGLEQDLDSLLHLGEPLGQVADEVDAALERGERLLERQLAFLEALHEPLELGEGLLEPGCLLGHQPSVSSTRARARLRAKTSATVSPALSAAASLTTGPAASPRRTMA